MRTKNLNLKKKIAFIASVAMIATTAAYLPNEVAQNIGVTTSVSANDDGTGAAVTAVKKINTFNAYVKINNKYLAKGVTATTEVGKFKLYNTLPSQTTLDSDHYELVDAAETANYLQAAARNDGASSVAPHAGEPVYYANPYDANDGAAEAAGHPLEAGSYASVKDDRFVVQDADGTTAGVQYAVVGLPKDTAVGATIEVEIVPNTKTGTTGKLNGTVASGFASGSAKSFEVKLDDHGAAQIPFNSDKVIVQSDAAADGTNSDHKDTVDFSGLKFQVAGENGTNAGGNGDSKFQIAAGSKLKVEGTVNTPAYAANATVVTDTVEADFNYIDDSKNDYRITKIDGHYVTNFTIELANAETPDTLVTVELPKQNNWTITGDKVTDGVLKVRLGSDGTAESGLITFANTAGTIKEYYNITVKNPAAKMNTQSGATVKVTGSGFDTNEGTAANKGFTLDGANGSTTDKIDTDIVTMNINGQSKFVKVFTVYNTWADDSTDKEITIEPTAAANNLTLAKNSDKVTLVATANFTDKVVEGGKISGTANAGGNGRLDQVKIKPTKSGTFTTPVFTTAIAATEAEGTAAQTDYFQIVFKNTYEVPYYVSADGKTYESKPAGKTTVVGTKVTKPEAPSLPGYTFKGWKTTNTGTAVDTAAQVFTASSDVQQSSAVTPVNTKLYAEYSQNTYSVEFDGNGGTLTVPAGSYTVVSRNNKNEATKANAKVTANSTDAVTVEAAIKANLNEALNEATDVVPFKNGYSFKGWALKADASVDDILKVDDFDKLKSTEDGGKVTVYAIYKAGDVSVTFKNFRFVDNADTDQSGAVEAGEDLDTTTAGIQKANVWDNQVFGNKADDFKTAANTTGADDYDVACVSKNGTIGTYSVKSGEKIGTLPEGYIKGYTFVGWYAEVYDAATETYTTEEITADTVLTNELIKKFAADPASGNDNDKLVLWARYTQNENTVTYDLDGGSFTQNDLDNNIMPYKYAIDAKGTVTAKNGTRLRPFANISNPVKGSGYYTFKAWTINDGVAEYATANLNEAIKAQSNVGDVTLHAVYQPKSTSYGGIALDLDGGLSYEVHYKATDRTKVDYYVEKSEAAPGYQMSGVGGVNIAETVDGTKISDSGVDYVVAKPGYKFEGWYADKEFTTPYTFSKYPKGKEDTVYAKWTALGSTRYVLNYSLVNADDSLVNAYSENNIEYKATNGVFSTTKIGTTDEVVKASDSKITVNGKTYVYDAKRSAGYINEAKVKATFGMGNPNHAGNVNNGKTCTSTEYWDGNNNKYLDGLNEGVFAVNSLDYTIIQGVYVEEGSVNDELGKATNVKVSDKGAVTFTAADNAVKYQVCKIVDGKKYYSAKTDATTINITPAKKDYQVYVIAFDENGKSTHSATVKVTVKATSTLGTVQNPKVTESLDDSGNKIGTVTWDKVEGATWYKVFKVVNGKTYWGSKVTENKYVFKNLPKDSSYIIYVAAGDDKGNVTYGARTKISKYPAVENVKISADKKTVSFDKAEGAVNYQVAKLINGKTYYGTKSASNSITMENAAKSGTQIFVLAFFTGEDGKTYSSYSQSITVE